MLDDLLDQLKTEGDTDADVLVAALANHHDLRALIALLENLIRLSDVAGVELEIHPAVRPQFENFLDAASKLPAWANEAHLHRGALHFRNHTAFAYVVLGCASLPNCYSWDGEARVLGETAKLVDKIHYRIPQTANFVADVMSRDGLNRSGGYTGVGIASARKVRLMHALMRHLILADPQDLDVDYPTSLGEAFVFMQWDTQSDGMPLNQEYLVGTLLTFSSVVIGGMIKYGFRIDATTRDAHLHIWNVVGYLLGVREDVLQSHLATHADCERMLRAIRRRNLASTQEGNALAEALIGYFRSKVPVYLGFAPLVLSKLLAGREVSGAVGLRYKWWHLLLVPLVVAALYFFAWLKRMTWTQKISNLFFAWLADRIWGWRGA